MENNFFERVGNLLEEARKNTKTAVNISMVYTYYEIGRMIIEEVRQVRLTLLENNTQIFASKYQTVLPSKDELKRLMEC